MSSGRPRHRGRHGNYERRHVESATPQAASADAAESSSPVVQMFREFATHLDNKHDRYERLVKKSRDVTIESKRIIFMLHRVSKDEQSAALLEEAAQRFRHLENTALREIAQELRGQDPYMFIRAISPGLQEYIEALSFYYYLLQDRLISWAEAQAHLTYPRPAAAQAGARGAPADGAAGLAEAEPPADATVAPPADTEPAVPDGDRPAADTEPESTEPVKTVVAEAGEAPADPDAPALSLLLPYHEYVLGIADLTGELMRKCISSVSSGELDQCWRLCGFLRTIHEGFINIGNTGPREITRKLSTLRQSVAKVENACYQLKVRGEEIPRHMLADVFSAGDDYPPPPPNDDYAGN
ncbi:translin-associated protein X-like [Pollicipes pollicipes]|uniref:translin-associated protein X-like n=1 Tax=Pollicipes pollicipes TaxID=41117 RepID=UPI001885998D|nr:translin-associated protein X-like [Pollicipes pollicipes]